MEQKRLYLSKTKVIGGVCGGLAEFFGFDPTIVRLVWALFTLMVPAGLFLYLVAMFIIPDRPRTGSAPDHSWHQPAVPERADSRNRILGLVLLAIGAVLLLNKLVPNISWPIVLAVVCIGLGLFLILKPN